MNDLEKTLQEEFKLLWRSTRFERSRFILIQYNHYDLVRKVKVELTTKYPNRKQHNFNLQKDLSNHFSNELLAIENGFIFIEHFDEILKSEYQKMASTLNQRRDAFRDKDTILLIFVPIGNTHLQDFSKALPDFYSIVSPIIQLVQTIEQSDETTISQSKNNQGFANSKEAKSEIERIEKRLLTLEDIEENKALRLALIFNLGKAYLFLAEYQKAKTIFEDLLKTNKNYYTPTEKSEILDRIATVEAELGNYAKAATIFEEALAIDLAEFSENHPTVATRQSNLANVYGNLGRYEEAATLLEIALQAAKNNFGENHPTVATRQSNLAIVYRNLGRYEEAATLLEIALQAELNNFGENHPTVATSQSNLATVYGDLGRYEEAATLLEIALQADLNNFGENHPTVATRQSNLANVYRNLGRYEEAATLLEIALQSDLNNFGENHPTVATCLNNLAIVYFQTKDFQRAIECFEKAYLIFLNHFGENHPNTKQVKGSLDYAKQKQK
jgi:tetratricopeptide (TPR) repeat protein